MRQIKLTQLVSKHISAPLSRAVSEVPKHLKRLLPLEPKKTDAYKFDEVLEDELELIASRRRQTRQGSTHTAAKGKNDKPADRAWNNHLLGLSLSGGGIRSATFNLGLLQALAKLKQLHLTDYLSTVSGGGYIGGWLQSLIKAEERSPSSPQARILPICGVEHRIGTRESAIENSGSHAQEDHSIRFLRAYSNYLTPKLGVFSGDTWALVATYLRNVMLNLLILILALSVVLLLPRLLAAMLGVLIKATETEPWLSAISAFVTLVLGMYAAYSFGRNFAGVLDVDKDLPNSDGIRQILEKIFLPILLATLLLCYWLPLALEPNNDNGFTGLPTWLQGVDPLWVTIFIAGMSNLLIWVIAWLAAVKSGFPAAGNWRQWSILVFTAALSGAVLGPVLLAIVGLFSFFPESTEFRVLAGPPLIALTFVLIAFLHTGLAKRAMLDQQREWLSRIGGWLLILSLGWLLLCSIVFFGPLLIAMAGPYLKTGLVSGWIVTTIGGLLVGRAEGESKVGGMVKGLLARIAPYIFIIGLFLLLSTALHSLLIASNNWHYGISAERGLNANLAAAKADRYEEQLGKFNLSLGSTSGQTATGRIQPSNDGLSVSLQFAPNQPLEHSYHALVGYYLMALAATDHLLLVTALILLLGVLALGLSRQIDVNEFSLNHMYGNRLARCYLGAAVPACTPGEPVKQFDKCRYRNPFTGFSMQDDIPLHKVGINCGDSPKKRNIAQGPFPIINTAINLVQGKELAWQERKSASFILTPLYCGFSEHNGGGELPGYRPSAQFAGKLGPLSLGQAIATSGAAAAPSMGHHTTAAAAFLLAMFNVRLGRWVGNPMQSQTWERSSPKIALWYFLREVFGFTHARSDFVYLSDGGHFENLGIYELVRRRCRYIIASDVGADPRFGFEDLGNAIRKCRIDFGVDIRIDIDSITNQDEHGCAEVPCAVGDIDYGGGRIGTLVYIKASRLRRMPSDLMQYAAGHEKFPHETTADQFFSESQFESYRRLGYEMGLRTLQQAASTKRGEAERNIELVFSRLREQWYRNSRSVTDHFTRHASTLDTLLDRLATRTELKFLDEQFYPEWRQIIEDCNEFSKNGDTTRSGSTDGMFTIPDDLKQLRAGFYFCNSLIQLMESVYVDLHLESEWEHPDNSGWMNLFRHWAWSGMFRLTWSVSVSTYGRRFRGFCERILGLELGEVQAVELKASQWEAMIEMQKDDFHTDGLNFFERCQVIKLVPDLRKSRSWEGYRLFLLRLNITMPAALEELCSDSKSTILASINFGYALIKGDRLIMFRIQDHLRKMNLGRKGMEQLVRKLGDTGRQLTLKPFDKLNDVTRSIIVESDAGSGKTGYERFQAMLSSVQSEQGLAKELETSLNEDHEKRPTER